jgi:hypothetical protein
VTHEHDTPTPVVESPLHRGSIVAEPGQGKIDRNNVVAAINEINLRPTPTPGPVPDAVNQHQRAHRTSSSAPTRRAVAR